MRRTTTVALVLGSLFASTAGTAAAARPIVVKPAPAETAFVIPAAEACGFDVEFVVPSGKTGSISFESGRTIYISPGLVVTLTNPANGATVTYNATGTFRDEPGVVLEDSSYQFRTTMRGHNLVFGPLDTGAGVVGQMKLYVGRVTATVTIGTDGIAVISEIDDRAAQVTDVCAALA